MTQVIVAAAVLVTALAVGAVLRRQRRPDAPTQPEYSVPSQIDRADFVTGDAPWLVAVFSSATCTTCRDIVDKAMVLACADVAVVDVEYSANTALHRKYRIDAVPILLLADRQGVVKANFVGPITATDLWAAVARARDEL
jgi:hypothetical protein